MYEFYFEYFNSKTKKFYINDKYNNPVFECNKTGFIEGFELKNIKEEQIISIVKYHQQFIVPGFKIIFKTHDSKIKVRESLLHDYKITGSNINIKTGNEPLTWVFVDDTKILADVKLSVETPKFYQIKIYDESKINIILSMALGLHICFYMSV